MMISDDNVTINQDYQISSQTQLSAVDSDFKRNGYKISYWTSNADGTGTRYDIDSIVNAAQVSDDLDFYAQWIQLFNLSAFVYPDGAGTVNNESPFISNDIEAGSTINLTAKKTYGHAFVDWSDGESQPERTVEMNATSSLTANFVNVSADLLLGVNDSAKGSTIGSGLIGYSESRGISAVANYGYEFTGWTKDQGDCEIGDVSLSATTLTSNSESQISVTANFKAMTLSVEYDAGYDNPMTKIHYTDGTLEEKDIVGELTWSSVGKSSATEENTTIQNVEIGTDVSSISDSALRYCTSLTSIMIPSSVTSIKDDGISKCMSLSSITIPDSVSSLGNYAFSNCTSLTSFTIPDSVISVGYWAFYNCTSLTSAIIGNSVTSIEKNTFGYCTSLTSINIPDSVTSIKNSAFSGCTSLTSINIPDSVTSIEQYAFVNGVPGPITVHSERVKQLVVDSGYTGTIIVV